MNSELNNISTTASQSYALLYTWYAVTDSRNICPVGWHVPTDSEWNTLSTYLGGISVAGGKLKESGTTHWSSPNTGATNESGFAAFPGGFRLTNGSFSNIQNNGSYWSSTEFSAQSAYYWYMLFDHSDIARIYQNKSDGRSVRCVKN
jgi:uncharacterized protein (TIGR02145 family)